MYCLNWELQENICCNLWKTMELGKMKRVGFVLGMCFVGCIFLNGCRTETASENEVDGVECWTETSQMNYIVTENGRKILANSGEYEANFEHSLCPWEYPVCGEDRLGGVYCSRGCTNGGLLCDGKCVDGWTDPNYCGVRVDASGFASKCVGGSRCDQFSHCEHGECVKNSCVEGSQICEGGKIYECRNGRYEYLEFCKSLVCQEERCFEQSECQAGDEVCFDGKILSCGEDGKLYVDYECESGECDELNKECIDVFLPDCFNGMRRCLDGVISLCVDYSWTAEVKCETGRCEDELNCESTLDEMCTRGDIRCSEGYMFGCVEDGMWQSVSVCETGRCANEYQCENGPEVDCRMGDTWCLDGYQYECKDGKWQYARTCESGRCKDLNVCEMPIGYECSNGSLKCENGVVYECNQGVWQYSVECSAGMKCENGQCVSDEVCTESVCDDGYFLRCEDGKYVEREYCTIGCDFNYGCIKDGSECIKNVLLFECLGNDSIECLDGKWIYKKDGCGYCKTGDVKCDEMEQLFVCEDSHWQFGENCTFDGGNKYCSSKLRMCVEQGDIGVECKVGEVKCEDSVVYECVQYGGTRWFSEVMDCMNEGMVCKRGKCELPEPLTPNKATCYGGILTYYDSDGSAHKKNCGVHGKMCDASAGDCVSATFTCDTTNTMIMKSGKKQATYDCRRNGLLTNEEINKYSLDDSILSNIYCNPLVGCTNHTCDGDKLYSEWWSGDCSDYEQICSYKFEDCVECVPGEFKSSCQKDEYDDVYYEYCEEGVIYNEWCDSQCSVKKGGCL